MLDPAGVAVVAVGAVEGDSFFIASAGAATFVRVLPVGCWCVGMEPWPYERPSIIGGDENIRRHGALYMCTNKRGWEKDKTGSVGGRD